MIELGTDEHDRRAIQLTTTTAGEEQAQRWLGDYVTAAGELFACLNAEDQLLLTRLLDQLANALGARG